MTIVTMHFAPAGLDGMVFLKEPLRPGIVAGGLMTIAGGIGLLATVH